MKAKGPPYQPQSQHKVMTVSKILLAVISLTFIVVSTAIGIQIWDAITPLGVFLLFRLVYQIYLAQKNNRRMAHALGTALAGGMFLAFPKMVEAEREEIRKIVGKKYRDVDKFVRKIEELPVFVQHSDFWETVIQATLKSLEIKGYNVIRPIDINVPIYGVGMAEVMDTVNSLTSLNDPLKLEGSTIGQVYPPRKIWLVLNDPDNDEVREGLAELVRARREAAESLYQQGKITAEDRDYHANCVDVLDLGDVADKRTAMAAGWLVEMKVEADKLPEITKEMFTNPEHTLELSAPPGDISLNVDSDTIAHPLAMIMTLLSFILFDLSGITSNVRIKNMNDATSFWSKALAVWTYYRYDFANNVERAAESWKWNVVCMSGPWMGVVTHVIPRFLGRFINYTFQGVRIKPGDDRKVTYELNRMKLRVGYCPWIETYTDAPTTWDRWRKQQDRWTMSMYANFFTSLKEGQLFKLHPWSMFDQLYAAGFTFLIIGVLVRLAIHCYYVAQIEGTWAVWYVVRPYLWIFLAINFLRGAYSAWDNKKWGGFSTSTYILVVVKELIPIKFIRLFIKGLAEKGYVWGGRLKTKKQKNQA